MLKDESNPLVRYSTEGYHGTSQSCALSIKKHNFNPSRGDDHWLGAGVYFFEAGISDALENAKDWGIVESWDNTKRKYKYEIYCVVKAVIELERLWDLTSREGLEFFERLRGVLRKRGVERSDSCSGRKFDNSVVEFTANQMKFDGLKCCFFIKLDKNSRKNRVLPGIPNVTVICVRDPERCIPIDKVKVVVEGSVNRR